MQKQSPINSDLTNDIDSTFHKLLRIGEKIERVTQLITTEIKAQKDKNDLSFLQKLQPKINHLAKLYQDELICIELIKHAESENGVDKPKTPLPLFILEERTWKKFNLINPLSELKLQNQTLFDLAIDYEIEQQKLSNESNKESRLKETIDNWKKELYLLGFSVQYKIKKKFNPQEFDSLLNTFSEHNQHNDVELNLFSQQFELKKNHSVAKSTYTAIKKELNDLSKSDSQTIDNFLREMEGFNQELESLTETVIPLPVVEKKPLRDREFFYIDEELADFLNPPQENINEQRALEIENEISAYFKKMDVVVKSSIGCDNRLLEYLSVRTKDIAKLLIEKDFLSEEHSKQSEKNLARFIQAELAETTALLLAELLEPIQKALLANIDKENAEISRYNKKYKKNRQLKTMSEQEWDVFRTKLLNGAKS